MHEEGSLMDKEIPDEVLYESAAYFVMTTVTTVGYGNLVPVTANERLFCMFLLVIGVIAFSFATASLSSIFTNVDDRDAAI